MHRSIPCLVAAGCAAALVASPPPNAQAATKCRGLEVRNENAGAIKTFFVDDIRATRMTCTSARRVMRWYFTADELRDYRCVEPPSRFFKVRCTKGSLTVEARFKPKVKLKD